MGQAKRNKETAHVTTEMHVTDRERATLAMFMVLKVEPENRLEQRQFEEVLAEFQLDEYADRVFAQDMEFSLLKTDPKKATNVEMTNATRDYLLKKLDGKMPSGWTRTLLGLSERMLSCKEGKYELPGAPKAKALPAA